MEFLPPLSQVLSHAKASSVHRDVVQHCVRTSKVHVFKDVRSELLVHNLLAGKIALKVNEHELPCLYVPYVFKAKWCERSVFRGEDILLAFAFAHNEWADAVLVPEGKHALSGNDTNDGIPSVHPPVEFLHSGAERIKELRRIRCLLELSSKDPQECFGIGIGVAVEMIILLKFFAQLGVVCEIAVVHECNTVRRVCKKRLGVPNLCSRSCSGVAGLCDTHVPHQLLEGCLVVGLAHIADAAYDMETAVECGDTGRVLAAMLEVNQSLIQLSCDRFAGGNTNDATHGLMP